MEANTTTSRTSTSKSTRPRCEIPRSSDISVRRHLVRQCEHVLQQCPLPTRMPGRPQHQVQLCTTQPHAWRKILPAQQTNAMNYTPSSNLSMTESRSISVEESAMSKQSLLSYHQVLVVKNRDYEVGAAVRQGL